MSDEPKPKKLIFKTKGPSSSSDAPNQTSPSADTKANEKAKEQEKAKRTTAPRVVLRAADRRPTGPVPPPAKEPKIPSDSKPIVKTPEKEATQSTPQPSSTSPATEVESNIFKFYCVYCGQKLSATIKLEGRIIKCPSCTRSIVIPPAP